MSDKKYPTSDRIYKKVITHRREHGKYPDKIYVGVDIRHELMNEATNENYLINPIEEKFMDIKVKVVDEEGHISFDASGVDKNQFVEAPLFLLI